MAELGEREVAVAPQQMADGLPDGVAVRALPQAAKRVQAAHDAGGILLDDTGEAGAQARFDAWCDDAHHAEVNEGDARAPLARQHEDITRMRVRMEEPHLNDLLEVE